MQRHNLYTIASIILVVICVIEYIIRLLTFIWEHPQIMVLLLFILNFSTLNHDVGRLGNIVKKVVSSLGMSLDSLLSALNSQEDTCNHALPNAHVPS